MNSNPHHPPLVAIACGGTGGHLFPGLAVAGELRQLGCEVALLISPKDVDQQAVKPVTGMEIHTLPAVGLQNRNYFSFAASFVKSLLAARRAFRRRRPQAVLAMGGFTSAPPIFAGKAVGARTYLHESNTIPGKANRFLARWVDAAFVGFPETAARLKARQVTATGTPVRPRFMSLSGEAYRAAAARLGLAADRPIVLVVGGSQGASGLNAMVLSALPLLAAKNWQWLHLTGAHDFDKVKAAYAARNLTAVVRPFMAEMDLALGVATAAVSRAGASSLAELAAVRLPALLVPFPAAADNHQWFNAQAYLRAGAARGLEQKDSTPEQLAARLMELVEDSAARAAIQAALGNWQAPQAAEKIAACIAGRSGTSAPVRAASPDVPGARRVNPKKLSAV
ncbi:MAG: undecaprenyldiphospho-muramoylpentapeptide beta-N-acetylglucosaminyltransferase [Verrucomicrobiae bacterium]|nr:undecaprenyldiphospho-muramoylpentapeptide beta-N-acetylglucosaminyltransferase [Verrucomicrobiae bacterium]